MVSKLLMVFLVLLLLSFRASAVKFPDCPSLLLNEDISELLSSGPMVVVIRHMRDSKGVAKSGKNCEEPNRMLTERGKREAAKIGEVIKAMQLPVNIVKASPTCRTIETAEIISPIKMEIDWGLEIRSSLVQEWIHNDSHKGIVILVTHGTNIKKIRIDNKPVVNGYKTPGFAAFFKPDNNAPILLGCLAPYEWGNLVELKYSKM